MFSTFGPMSGWLPVWILLFTRGASASDIPVAYSATWLACGVLGRTGGSARCIGFCTIPTCILVLGVWCFCCCCSEQDWGHWLSLLTALIVLDLRPIALRLSAIAMFLHVSRILAVGALKSRVSNFLTSSLSVRAQTTQNWTFCSFSSSVGKLHLLARALRQSTSSSGVSPDFICTLSNWYTRHHWETVWSIWDAKLSRKDFALFLVAAISSVVTAAGVHLFHL